MDLQPGMDYRVPGFLEDPRVRAVSRCALRCCAALCMLGSPPRLARAQAQGAAALRAAGLGQTFCACSSTCCGCSSLLQVPAQVRNSRARLQVLGGSLPPSPLAASPPGGGEAIALVSPGAAAAQARLVAQESSVSSAAGALRLESTQQQLLDAAKPLEHTAVLELRWGFDVLLLPRCCCCCTCCCHHRRCRWHSPHDLAINAYCCRCSCSHMQPGLLAGFSRVEDARAFDVLFNNITLEL